VCGATPQTARPPDGTLAAMSDRRPLHVVIAGGGPAAAEAALALHEHAGRRVRLTLVAPEPRLFEHARLPEPFCARHPHRSSIRAVAADVGGAVRAGRVAAVDGDGRRLCLADRRRLDYDALVLAVGARPRPAYERALTFFGRAGAVAINRLTAEVGDGFTRALAFVVPPGMTWPLPLYELAIQTANALRGAGHDVGVRLITPEPAPLALFGAASRGAVTCLLDEAGIAFTGSTAVVQGPGGVLCEGADGPPLLEDRVVALPVLEGPALPGVPATGDGFVLVDGSGAVPGLADAFAAGDATCSPVKHLDAARAQAALVAAALAARAGAYVPPEPPSSTVRAHLVAGGGRTLVLERP
jgi:sulfide:quinone oxidoreductase